MGTIDADLAAAFCGSAALIATMPVIGTGPVPPIVRAALALAITPLLGGHDATHPMRVAHSQWLADFLTSAPRLVLTGAGIGLSATLIAGAAVAAGGALDIALGSPPTGGGRFFGPSPGPFALLYATGFGLAMLAGGGAVDLIRVFADVARASAEPALRPPAVSALTSAGLQAALALAAPAIFAQMISTLAAAAMSRVAPRSNALLFATAMASILIVVVVLSSATGFLPALADLSSRCAELVRGAWR
jgi:flagellar biosynthesis protein FliR